MKSEIRLLPPAELTSEFPEAELRKGPLYNQPFYCELIKPGKLRFAEVALENTGISYFPLTTDRLFFRRRIFILPYCQRFTPFQRKGSVLNTQTLECWTRWMQENAGACQWRFSSEAAAGRYQEKINQVLDLRKSADELFSCWKKGRKSALMKSGQLQTELLSVNEFKKELRKLNSMPSGKGWSPGSFEMSAILRISDDPEAGKMIERYGVYEGGECLSLILLFYWNERCHYLFSQSSSRGFQLDALTRFFFFLIEKKAGTPLLFDFEGSSIPGIYSYFKSLGAEEEIYYEFRKP